MLDHPWAQVMTPSSWVGDQDSEDFNEIASLQSWAEWGRETRISKTSTSWADTPHPGREYHQTRPCPRRFSGEGEKERGSGCVCVWERERERLRCSTLSQTVSRQETVETVTQCWDIVEHLSLSASSVTWTSSTQMLAYADVCWRSVTRVLTRHGSSKIECFNRFRRIWSKQSSGFFVFHSE